MQVLRRLDERAELAAGAVVAIGFFDGVHLGHQQLLGAVRERARECGAASVAITFEDHPQCLFTPGHCPSWLTAVDEKIAALGALGLEVVYAVPFDWSVANRTADEFVRDLLCARLRMRLLVCGADFALGQGRVGTVDYLRQLGAHLHFEVEVVAPRCHEGEVISSTRIRDFIAAGEVAVAARLLGRPYRIAGRVVSGRGLGRQIGVPTLNLEVEPRKTLPQSGVYAARAEWDGVARPCAVNLGHRPTVGGGALVMEAHVIDETIEVAPPTVALHFVDRLRDERNFPCLDDLVAQIRNDIDEARELLQS